MNESKARRRLGATIAAAAVLSLGLALAPSAWAQKVRLATNLGDIVVELDAAKAPKSVENFVQYVKAGHYDGTIFHRVIDGFMIQGGGFTPDRVQKPTRAPIALEAGNGLSNVRGTMAMARTAAPDSATAQFFINVVDNLPLDSYGGGYAVFGKVVAGMDVVDRIKATPTVNKGAAFANLPATDVVIHKATLED
ncbi:peptidylprolyl isomerase [Sphaerotilus sulfidivorans]|jgi:peptidyl-prolyl cis-trans isomerase A (cyclophilin A)